MKLLQYEQWIFKYNGR